MNAKDVANEYFKKAQTEVRGYASTMKQSWSQMRTGGLKGTMSTIFASLGIFVLAALCFALLLTPVMSVGLFVGLLVVFFGPPLWVFVDATNRRVERPFLWSLFALVTPPVGALLYLLVRPDKPKLTACDTCGRVVSHDYAACPYCGASRAPVGRSCPSCQCPLDSEWAFCPYCRLDLSSASAAPPVTADANEKKSNFCRSCGATLQPDWNCCPLCKTAAK